MEFFSPVFEMDGSQQAPNSRRALMMSMMLAGNRQPTQGQMVNGIYVPPSPLNHVNNALSQLASIYFMNQSMDAEDQQAEQRKAALKAMFEGGKFNRQAAIDSGDPEMIKYAVQDYQAEQTRNAPKESKFYPVGNDLVQLDPNTGTTSRVYNGEDPQPKQWTPGTDPQGRQIWNAPGEHPYYPPSEPAAPVVNVNTGDANGNQFKNMGEMDAFMRPRLDAANAAAQKVRGAQQIQQLAQSGNLLTGPGADVRAGVLKLGQAIGINGKDENEILQNTIAATQNRMRAALDAASQLKGPASDRDIALIRQSVGADLPSAEALAAAGRIEEKAAREAYAEYGNSIKFLRQQNPQAADLYKPLDLPPPIGWTVLPDGRYRGPDGTIYERNQ